MHGLKLAGIELDRKVLSDLAIREVDAFKALVDQAEAALKKAA
jgi:large subunit ribosomal protein L20